MGGKSTTSTQSVQIPPEVLARYNAVNKRAEDVAKQPFQAYTGEFVAPVNQQQLAGFSNINKAATSAQPYYGAATGLTLAGSQGVGPLTGGQINQYMSPYLGSVVGSTLGNLSQEQAMQRQQQIGDAIKSGAFGGDRSGLAAANLARQQGLAYGQTAAGLLNTGYNQALQTAQGQQQIQQADLSRMLQGGAQLGALGSNAQQAALTGAQAQVGAGTLQQQTQQAQDTAQYQQFLQERGYPFQVAQFLANIAMGTGALSGSTTTTTQPQTLFSDERLKENITPVGELNDGQTIYRYNYKGDPRTQIGLLAQEVAGRHPEAVGASDGYLTVDYRDATDDAAAMASRGGLVPSGMDQREAFAPGGLVDPNDMQALIASQARSFGPFAKGGLYGGERGGMAGAMGYVPGASVPVGHLITAGSLPQQRPSGLAQAMDAAGKAGDLGNMISGGYDFGKRALFGTPGVKGGSGQPDQPGTKGFWSDYGSTKSKWFNSPSKPEIAAPEPAERAHGGIVPGYASGGETNPYELNSDPLADVLKDQQQNKIEPIKPGQAPGAGSSFAGDALKAAGAIGSAASGLGTIASGAAKILPFLGLARGGVAGYADGGPAEGQPDIRQIIIEEAVKRGIPPELALKQAQVESGLKPNAVGGSGERGLFQIMPSTAKDPGYGVKPIDMADIEDPRKNAGFGLDYLKARAERAGLKDWSDPEQVAAGLRAYNGGGDPRYVEKIMGATPAMSAIDRASPRGGLSPEGIQAPSKFGSEQPQSWGDFLTSRQFIVPLLTGIGAAATTPTRNLGTALAAGLGAGAQSYAGQEKQIAEAEKTRAETRATETNTYQKSFMQTPSGNFVWLADGSVMFAGDYDELRRAGKEPPLLGRIPDNANEVIRKWVEARKSAQPPAEKTAAAAPPPAGAETAKALEATKPPEAAKAAAEMPTGVNFDETSKERAKADSKVSISGGPAATSAQKITDHYLNTVVPTAEAARESSRYLSELAENLSRAAQGKGLDAPGFGFDARAQAVSALNTLSRAFGGAGEFGQADTISDINNKIETLQASIKAAGGNQESFAALSALKKAVANPNMSPRAFSQLSADLMAQNQRAIDRDNHRSVWMKESSGLLSGAGSDFERTNPSSKYTKEAEVLQRIILREPDLIKELRSGRYPANIIDKKFEKLGVNGMSRYFVGGR